MGTRALRKLREQEWQRQLTAAQAAETASSEESDDEPVNLNRPQNAFDMLNDAEEDEDDEDEHRDTSTVLVSSQPSPPRSSTSTPKLSKKKKKKPKKKQKDATATPQPDPSKAVQEDEIDKALKELALKQAAPSERDPTTAQDAWKRHATQHLAIENKNLDPVNEMRGLFGNVALEDEARRSQPSRRRDQNLQGGVDLQTALTGRYNRTSRGKELGSFAKRRNCLMQGRDEWPLATSGGLSMEALPTTTFERRYNILHNQTYRAAQWDFRLAVESMQAEAMIELLQKYPYHIATLLQVSEIARHQGDASLSGDLLQRALYTFGRSVNSSFSGAIREGTARLSFDKPPNRELYLTIWRYIRNLEQRGTWKTAYEWAKLLLQFDPRSDPFGVTLMIDQLALRGRQHEQFLAMTSENAYGSTWSHLPNICISKTLALLRADKPREARQQLALAMHRYPYILAALASALEVSPMPKSIWGKLPSTDAEKLYSELYVTRAKDLWNTPETIGIVSEVANTLQYYQSYVESQPVPPKPQISLEEARHVMALEIPALIALLPRQFTTMPTSSSDVLPPPDSEASDLVRRAPAEAARASPGVGILQAGNEFINRLFGWVLQPSERSQADPGATQQGDAIGAQDLAELRQQLGPQAANLSDAELRTMIGNMMAAEFGELDDEELQEAFRVGGMAGGWDYYDDAARNGDSEVDSEDLPDLEDVVGPNSTVGAAVAGEVIEEYEEPMPARGPRVATVEEADDENDEPQPSRDPGGPTGPILRHVDEDESPAFRLGAPANPSQRLDNLAEPAPNAEPLRPPQPLATPAGADGDIESNPQRLQRWLITAGLDELKMNPNMSTYVRRLKMLNKNQQNWILGVVRQRGSGDLAAKVQDAL